MRILALFIAAASSLLTSCQMRSGVSSVNHSRGSDAILKAGSSSAKASSTGLAGTTGMSGYAGTASASPFAPAALPPSARFVPPDRYWGFGGGYSKTGGTDRANDDLNFFRESIYCRHRCYGSSYYNSCYRNSCYTPRYSSGCYYPSSYSSRYCWR